MRMPLYHLVGALDPLAPADLVNPIGDGFPETLDDWMRRDGLTHLKVKLNGENLDWDVDRFVGVDRVAETVQRERGVKRWHYSADFNEKCPHVSYLLEFLGKVRERTPAGFERLQYVEQPTARDLKANRTNVMHEAAKLRPVVIDESLTDLESLQTARAMGYTGAASRLARDRVRRCRWPRPPRSTGCFCACRIWTCAGACSFTRQDWRRTCPAWPPSKATHASTCRRPTWHGRNCGRAFFRCATGRSRQVCSIGLG